MRVCQVFFRYSSVFPLNPWIMTERNYHAALFLVRFSAKWKMRVRKMQLFALRLSNSLGWPLPGKRVFPSFILYIYIYRKNAVPARRFPQIIAGKRKGGLPLCPVGINRSGTGQKNPENTVWKPVFSSGAALDFYSFYLLHDIDRINIYAHPSSLQP